MVGVPAVVFHVATLMPSKENEHSNKKLHIGNDCVVVVYNDSAEQYSFGTIKVGVAVQAWHHSSRCVVWIGQHKRTHVSVHILLPAHIESSSLLCTFQGQFNFYEVVIEPLPEGCNRVLIQTKQGVDKGIDQRSALVSDQWLPMYVRLLALHANVSVSSGTWSVAGCCPPPSPPLPFPHRWRVWLTDRCLDGEAQTGWSVCTRSIESSPSSGLPPRPLMGRTHC